jgi:hypothetical protein
MNEEHAYSDGYITYNGNGLYQISTGGISTNLISSGSDNMYETLVNKNYEDFKLPDVLIEVIKKTYPDIVSIEIDSVDVRKIVNPYSFDVDVRYRVNLIITNKWDTSLSSSPDSLSDEIQTMFSCLFTNVDYADFRVKSIRKEGRDINKEFYSIFGVKK